MGIPTLLSTSTVTSATSSVSITSNITSTYDEYMFVITDFHPSNDGMALKMAASTDGGSNYTLDATSTMIKAHHLESGATQFGYHGDGDTVQTYPIHVMSPEVGNDNDESGAGIVHLFSPASTTYVKHFLIRVAQTISNPGSADVLVGGYWNTTSDIDAVQFTPTAGTIDNIVIQMYGIA